MSEVQISIVIPVYNEEANLAALMQRLVPVMQSIRKPFEIVLIADVDRDNSLNINELDEILAIALRIRQAILGGGPPSGS